MSHSSALPAAYREAILRGAKALAAGALADAIVQFRQAFERYPADPVAGLNLLTALRRQGDSAAALKVGHRLVQRFPNRWEPARELGRLLQSQGQWADAELWLRRSVALHPAQPDLVNDLGLVLVQLGRLDEAEQCYDQAIRSAPNPALARANLAELHLEQRRYDLALAGFTDLLCLSPNDPRFMVKLAGCYRRAGDLAAAEHWLRQAMTQGDSGRAIANLGFLLLSQGRYRDGWAAYRRRDIAAMPGPQLDRPAGGWAGRCIRFLPDQGLGDELFFARFIPRLRAQGAEVRFWPQDKIRPLLMRCPALVGCLVPVLSDEQVDCVAPIGDAAFLADHQDGDGEPPPLRLVPAPDKLAAADQLLGGAPGDACLGVAWRGGLMDRPSALVKVIAPDALAQAVRGFAGTIIVLQRAPTADEMSAFTQALGRPVIDASHANDDLDLMIAILARLTHMAGVSNTNVHLRASLGGDAHILVPAPSDFRWCEDGSTSPWFPGMTIYRQQRDGDWLPALNDMARALSST